MLKKIFIACCFINSMGVLAFADRFYVGGQAGMLSDYFTYNPNALPAVSIATDQRDNGRSAEGGGLIGYSHCFGNNICGSIEGNIFIYGNNKATNTIQSLNSNVLRTALFNHRIKNSYGIQLKPGYYLTDNIFLYGDIGYITSNMKSNFNFSYSDGTPTLTGDYNQDVNGFTYGTGAEININERWGLRGEFLHTQYNAFDNSGFPDASFSARFRPQANLFTLGLIYSFGSGFVI